MRAWWRLSQGSDRGAVALSRNAQAEQRSTGLRQGWLWSRLSRAGLNSVSDSDGGDGGWKAQRTAAAVTVGGGRDARTQGFAGGGGGGKNVKLQFGQPPQVYIGLFVVAEKSPCQFSLFLANLSQTEYTICNSILRG